jgi:hypothetical protein
VDSTAVQDFTYEYKVAAVDSGDNEGSMGQGASVTVSSNWLVIVDSVVHGEGAGPGQFSGISRGEIDAAGRIWIYDRGNDRLQRFDSAGNYLSLTASGFKKAMGFAFGNNSEFYIADLEDNKAIKYDLSGNVINSWIPGALPRSLLFLNDTLYVLTYNGIETYNSSDSLVKSVSLALDFSKPGGDFTVNNIGNIFLSDGSNIYQYFIEYDSISLLYHIPDSIHNQNPRICFIGQDFILISCMLSSSPLMSSFYLVNISGDLIARYYSLYYISDIISKDVNELVAFTTSGGIFFLNIIY